MRPAPARRSALGTALAGLALLVATSKCTALVGVDKDYQLVVTSDDAGAAGDAADAGGEAGTCGDTVTSADHCGACGHSCLGGACAQGRCQPVLLAQGQPNPEAIALAGTDVYWTNIGNGSVVTVPVAGGSPRAVATNQAAPRGIASGAFGIVWSNLSSGEIAILATGGVPAIEAMGINKPHGVAVDGDDIFWTAKAPVNGKLVKKARGKTAQDTLADLDNPTALVVRGESVYVVVEGAGMAMGSIVRVPRVQRGQPSPIATNQRTPRGVAVDATSVYWTAYDDGNILAAPIGGGASRVIASSQFHPTEIVADAAGVYWVNEFDGGAVVQYVAGTVTVLVSGQASPHALAIDAKSVYWSTFQEGKIQRIAR